MTKYLLEIFSLRWLSGTFYRWNRGNFCAVLLKARYVDCKTACPLFFNALGSIKSDLPQTILPKTLFLILIRIAAKIVRGEEDMFQSKRTLIIALNKNQIISFICFKKLVYSTLSSCNLYCCQLFLIINYY